jgi:predicted deacylase
VETEGFFVPAVNLGEYVKNGDVIGQVQDKSDVVSQYDGAMISLSRINYVFEGDSVARIAAPLGDGWTTKDAEEEEQAPKRRKW